MQGHGRPQKSKRMRTRALTRRFSFHPPDFCGQDNTLDTNYPVSVGMTSSSAGAHCGVHQSSESRPLLMHTYYAAPTRIQKINRYIDLKISPLLGFRMPSLPPTKTRDAMSHAHSTPVSTAVHRHLLRFIVAKHRCDNRNVPLGS